METSGLDRRFRDFWRLDAGQIVVDVLAVFASAGKVPEAELPEFLSVDEAAQVLPALVGA